MTDHALNGIDYRKYRMCTRKRRFDSKNETLRFIRKHKGKTRGGTRWFTCYKCPHCDGWHITKNLRRE